MLIEEIQATQEVNPQLVRLKMIVLEGKELGFVIHEDRTLRFHNWVRVPAVDVLKSKILDEGHNTPHYVQPNGNKLYKDLKQTLW